MNVKQNTKRSFKRYIKKMPKGMAEKIADKSQEQFYKYARKNTESCIRKNAMKRYAKKNVTRYFGQNAR